MKGAKEDSPNGRTSPPDLNDLRLELDQETGIDLSLIELDALIDAKRAMNRPHVQI
tara:strand:+ start:156 stop:323 length:168 start_codon:yes stop_codon:yes gene_type:complete